MRDHNAEITVIMQTYGSSWTYSDSRQPVFPLMSRCCMLRVEAKTQEDNILVNDNVLLILPKVRFSICF